jgi:type IV pilus assembly protein PilW
VLGLAGATPSLTDDSSTECLATGVEDLQIEYGIDTDADAAPNYYTSTPDAAELTQLAAARVSLLARAEQQDPYYTNPKTYTLNAGKVVTPGDSFYRRLLSTTVLLRNPAALGTFR